MLFSGGVDSSLLLILATHAARASGRADPIPITYRYDAERTRIDEPYQDVVVRGLHLKEWLFVERPTAEIIGDDAVRAIGLLGRLPAVMTAHVHLAAIDLAAASPGSVLITGEGGDETFGPQVASIPGGLARSALRNWRAPRRVLTHVRNAARFAGERKRPRSMREWYPFLTDEAERVLGERSLLPPKRHPLDRLQAIDRAQRRGYVMNGLSDIELLAAHHGVEVVHPLREDSFVVSLIERTPARAFTSRAALIDRLWPGLLPVELMERRRKAIFNDAYFGDACRAFARAWDGRSLASPYIDNARLRATWLSDRPMPGAHLLQAAWAAENDLLPADSA